MRWLRFYEGTGQVDDGTGVAVDVMTDPDCEEGKT
jgi:hypothetical protein